MDVNEKIIYDIRHMVILALGSSKHIKSVIKEIYGKNEILYYQNYLNSKLKDDFVKEYYPARDLETINMLIGIFQNDYEKNDYTHVDTIIKAFNPHIFRFIKNKTIIDIDEFLAKEFFESKHIKKVGDGIFFNEILDENDIYNTVAVLMYIANRHTLEMIGLYIERCFDGYQKKLYPQYVKNKLRDIDDHALHEVEKLKSELKLTNEFISRQPSVGVFLDNIIEYQIEDSFITRFGEEVFKKRGSSNEEYAIARRNTFKKGISKYIGATSILPQFYDFYPELNLASVPVSVDVVNTILFACVSAERKNKIPHPELSLMFFSGITLYSAIYLYNDLKYEYLHSEQEKHFKDIITLQTELESRYHDFLEQENQMNHKLEESNLRFEQLERELTETRNELRLNQKTINQLSKENESLQALVTSYKEQQCIWDDIVKDQESFETELSLDEMVIEINKFKVVIFGGNKATLSQLKLKLENLTVFEKNTIDISALYHSDGVFVCYQWLKHSLSYKLWSEAKKTNIKIHYLSGTNYKQIVHQIYRSLKRD